jgi:hypothetical protein
MRILSKGVGPQLRKSGKKPGGCIVVVAIIVKVKVYGYMDIGYLDNEGMSLYRAL